jgi:hypothetical protein
MITVAHGNVFEYWNGYWSLLTIAGDLISKAGVFWLVFDLSLNLMRPGKAWNYISFTNGKFFDRIFWRTFKGFFIVDVGTNESMFVKSKDGAHKSLLPDWKLQWLAKGLLILIGELIYYIT